MRKTVCLSNDKHFYRNSKKQLYYIIKHVHYIHFKKILWYFAETINLGSVSFTSQHDFKMVQVRYLQTVQDYRGELKVVKSCFTFFSSFFSPQNFNLRAKVFRICF